MPHLKLDTDCIVNKAHGCEHFSAYREGAFDALEDVLEVLIEIFPHTFPRSTSVMELLQVDKMRERLKTGYFDWAQGSR